MQSWMFVMAGFVAMAIAVVVLIKKYPHVIWKKSDCVLTEWVADAACSDGMRGFSRKVESEAKNGGLACDVLVKKEPCVAGSASTTHPPTIQAATTKPPTIQEPTTQAPTTQAPTIQEPTTHPPTTQAPTTHAPTTQAPTTHAPTTQAPTTQAPMTQAPTTQAPTTQAPTTQAPTTQAPTTQAPTTQAPTQAPTTQAPTQAPTTQAPTTQAPTAKAQTGPPPGFPTIGIAVFLHADSLPLGPVTDASPWRSSAERGGFVQSLSGTGARAVERNGARFIEMPSNDDFFVNTNPNRLQTHIWSADVTDVRRLSRDTILFMYDQQGAKGNGNCDGECYRFIVDGDGTAMRWNGLIEMPNERLPIPASGKTQIAVVFGQSAVTVYAGGVKMYSAQRVARFSEPGSADYKYSAGSQHTLSFAHRERAPGLFARGLVVYDRALSDSEVASASVAIS